MKGNQGLEALAELCGGVMKAREGTEEAPPASGGTATATAPAGHQESGTPQVSNVGTIPRPTGRTPLTETTMTTETANNPSLGQQQRWQQVVANTTANPVAPLLAATPGMANADGLNAMQQVAYFQYIQAQAAVAAQLGKPNMAAASVGQFIDPNKAAAAAMALTGGQPAEVKLDAPQLTQEHLAPEAMKIIPGPGAPSSTPMDNSSGGMHPPAPQVPSVPSIPAATGMVLSTAKQPNPQLGLPPGKIVPLKPQQADLAPQKTAAAPAVVANNNVSSQPSAEDKKQLKRAANRRSAQLSRKRKKQFIEELKEENDELRRKEQILKSIPDLIVVFDSAGKLWFVSHSVSRLLNFTPQELEGNSFWDRLCDESVRLLKAAFMDALAARQSDMDTAPLGSGVWELRLVDKDGSYKVVTLNGVVHFSGDAPECVCSIRPREENQNVKQIARGEDVSSRKQLRHSASGSTGSSSDSTSSSSGQQESSLISSAIQPHQSVISNGSSDDSVSARAKGGNGGRRATQISDDDSCVSESGSDP